MITPQEALQRTIEHREVFHDEMLHIVRLIMSGECSPVMMAALITGLRVKKETIGEITAAAQVMREVSTKVPVKDTKNLVDIVGTGGDEHRAGRDVEGVRGIAARAAGVHQVALVGDLDGGRQLSHHLRRGGDLTDGLLLHAQPHDEAGDLRRRQLAAHDLAHDVQHLVVEHLAVLDGALDRFCRGDLLHARFPLEEFIASRNSAAFRARAR